MRTRFISLKWKLLLLLAGILFSLVIGVSVISYLYEARLQQQQRQQHHQQNIQELEAQVHSAQQLLIKRLEYLTLLLQNDSAPLTGQRMSRTLAQHFSNTQVLWGIESLKARTATRGEVLKQGDENPTLRQLVRQAISDEQPVVGLSCDSGCRALAAVPVILAGGETGGVGVATSLAEVVFKARQQNGFDTGVLLKASQDEDLQLPGWGFDVVALSNKERVLPQLLALSTQQRLSGAGSYQLEWQGSTVEVTLTHLEGLDDQRQAYWVQVADVSSAYQAIQHTVMVQLGVTLGALVVCGLLLVGLLNRPLNKLIQLAEVLPSLASRDFDRVRQPFQHNTSYLQLGSDDELSLLVGSTVQLADELERLDREMRARNLKLQRSSRQLSRQRDFASGLLDNAQAVILVQDTQGRCRSLNRFGRRLIADQDWQSGDRRFTDLFGELDQPTGSQMDELYDGLRHHLRHETRCADAYGNQRTLSWSHSVLTQNDLSNTILSIGMDVTEQVKVERQLRWLANHDSLTKLPNRSHLQNQLSRRINQARDRQQCLAVLFCDLDNFKQINDTLGHPIGDALLMQVAERLTKTVRHQDFVARLGGDEFVILLDDLNHHEDVMAVADKVLLGLEAPYKIDSQELFASASIGIAYYPDHGQDATTLIKNADIAMYQSKSYGRKQYSIYSHHQSDGLEERLNLTADLRHAIERGEFHLYYQPQLSIDCQTIVGVEALIRWFHPQLGMVPPDKFIGIAEETGQIVELGRWVINEACSQLARWHQQGLGDLRMAINLAGPQIMSESLLDEVDQALIDSGIEPQQLEFEITEGFVMSQPEHTIARLNGIKDRGIQLSIDDFGTGYSSLSYLKKLPIDKLKIDKSFVFDIGHNRDDEAIARAVIGLGRSLNLKVIAEGVEEAQHVSFLRQNGCDELQGFYFSKPLPSQECAEYIRRFQPQPLEG